MNRLHIFLGIIIVMLSSCYKDKSTIEINTVNQVIIDTIGFKKDIFIGFLDTLSIDIPVYTEDVDITKDLIYTWSLNVIGTKPDFETIGSDRVLKYIINRPISNVPYILKLEVNNPHNQLSYNMYWNIYINSSYGDGILVAYTDDNIKSDVALIMDKKISTNYSKSLTIRKGLLEKRNNEQFPIINSCCYSIFSARYNDYTNILWLTTEDGDIRGIDCKDYSRIDDRMIWVPDGFRAYRFVNSRQHILMFSNQGVYKVGKMNDRKPSMPMVTPEKGGDTDNGVVSTDSHNQGAALNTVWYSQTLGAFVHISNFTMNFSPCDEEPDGAFNPAKVSNKKCIAAGLSTNKEIHTFLLRDKQDGTYAIYTFNREDYANNISASARSLILLPTEAQTVLDNAISVFFMSDYPIMYIATPTAIYTLNFVSSPAIFNPSPVFMTEGVEQIKLAKLYQQGIYTEDRETIDGNGNYTMLPIHNRAVLLAVSNSEFDNKVMIIPMADNQVASGKLITDRASMIIYGGFSKILDIIAQGK